MAYKLFIQSNDEQYLGALVAGYAAKRNSRQPDAFDVEIMHFRDFPWLSARVGQKFLRGLEHRVWTDADLQSFTPVRFSPPKTMGYEGRDAARPQFTDHCFTGDYPTALTDIAGEPSRQQLSLLAEAG